ELRVRAGSPRDDFPRTTEWLRVNLSRSDLRSADGDRRDLDGGATDADRNVLTVLAAGPDAVRHLDVVAEHGDLAENVGAVADQVHAFQRRGDLAVLHEIALGEREHEVAVRDVD